MATRTKAQALILAGQIQVNGLAVQKMGAQVPLDATLSLLSGPRFVSRGGEKLEGALDDFSVSPAGLRCLDVGSSTGGFTDCLLQRGATHVTAVDVGRAQLHAALRADPRVTVREETHVADLQPRDFSDDPPRLVTIDVSFISLTRVLPHIVRVVPRGATVLPMVKPQFEVGAKFLRRGVVKDIAIRDGAVTAIEDTARSLGFTCHGRTPARLPGPKGNQEFFLFLTW